MSKPTTINSYFLPLQPVKKKQNQDDSNSGVATAQEESTREVKTTASDPNLYDLPPVYPVHDVHNFCCY